MPNLRQIYSIKQEFKQLTNNEESIKKYIEDLETKDFIRRAFDYGNIKDYTTFSMLNESLNIEKKPDLIKYFDSGPEEDVALLFIDITNFSKTTKGFSNSKIKNYLDEYYKEIIPIIYDNGGEIEKLMGDGIICVFGPPFIQTIDPFYVLNAETCAEKSIKKFHNTNKNVKVAIHKGKITYYKVPGQHYGEYTMIGQPITDLYRLESVSKSNSINFFTSSEYDKLGWSLSNFDLNTIDFKEHEINELQGIDFRKIKTIKFPNYL